MLHCDEDAAESDREHPIDRVEGQLADGRGPVGDTGVVDRDVHAVGCCRVDQAAYGIVVGDVRRYGAALDAPLAEICPQALERGQVTGGECQLGSGLTESESDRPSDLPVRADDER